MIIILAIVILSASLSVNAQTKTGCYYSGRYGIDDASNSYAGGEFGCEASKSSFDWFGGYVGISLLYPVGHSNSSRDFNGVNFGIRKNFKLISFAKYRNVIPYIGFGGVLTLVNDSTLEVDKGEIGSAKFTAIVPSIGLKIPITKAYGINPSIRYILPVKKENDGILSLSAGLYIF